MEDPIYCTSVSSICTCSIPNFIVLRFPPFVLTQTSLYFSFLHVFLVYPKFHCTSVSSICSGSILNFIVLQFPPFVLGLSKTTVLQFSPFVLGLSQTLLYFSFPPYALGLSEQSNKITVKCIVAQAMSFRDLWKHAQFNTTWVHCFVNTE